MGPDSKRIRENITEHPAIIAMHEKARKLLDTDATDPHDFVDLYGSENVKRDLNHIAKVKAEFKYDGAKRASEVMEALVYTHIELSDWLGPNAETIRPSEYDDIVNKVDIIVEFSDGESSNHLALGVDITFGSVAMIEKFEQIKKEIDEDELAKVKYFESHGFKGSLRQLPRVVIGVEIDKVVALAGMWGRDEKANLGKHITKDIIAEEVVLQLQKFLEYSMKYQKENATKSYTRALNTLKHLVEKQHTTRQDRVKMETVSADRVLQNIKAQLANNFS